MPVAGTGSTIHHIAAARPTEVPGRLTSMAAVRANSPPVVTAAESVVRVVREEPVAQVESVALVVREELVALAESAAPVVRVELAAPAESVVRVVPVARAAPAESVVQVVPVARAESAAEVDPAAVQVQCRQTAAEEVTASATAASRAVAVSAPVAARSAVAAAEVPRVPPAVAAVPAWAAAVLVVGVAAAVEVEAAAAEAADEVEAAAEGAGDKMQNGVPTMKTNYTRIYLTSAMTAVITLVGCLVFSRLEAATPKAGVSDKTTAPAQKEFNSPKDAADALIAAAASFDANELKAILGSGSDEILASADPVEDKNKAEAFAAKAKEKMSLGAQAGNPNAAILTVGNDDFPLPIPIVKHGAKWTFDTKIGRQEILNRRVGANELDAIAICRGFVEAQEKYAQEKHDDSNVNQYAQRVVSSPGKHDGLAWQNADGTWGGPVGAGIARAIEQGYSKQGQPFHGYYFKVLKGQGPAAPMGKMDFVVEGAMIGGFALVAAPAQYRVTGVKTFLVGPNGVVYQKDLHADTLKAFQEMDRYNPDKTWTSTDDDWPPDATTAQGDSEAQPNAQP